MVLPPERVALTPTPAEPMVPARWRAESFHRETRDTFTLALVPADGAAPFPFEPGQFNMLYAFGVGEVPISISGDSAHPERLIHTIRSVGPVTAAMSRLKRSQMIGVRGPYGAAWPVEEARGHDVVVVAGGIGLAPLRPAIYYILAHRQEYGRVVVIYGARTPADMLYVRELETWRGRFDLDVQVTVDAAGSDWRGNVGVAGTLLPRVRFEPDDAIAMICGPEIMMRFTAIDLAKTGVADGRIYLSMERSMKCALGFCGHCQYGPTFVCKDGPVFQYSVLAPLLRVREV